MRKLKLISKIYSNLYGHIGSYFLKDLKKYTHLIVKGDGSSWVQEEIAKDLILMAKNLNIKTINSRYRNSIKNQCIYHIDKYSVLQNWKDPLNRIAFPYYHGKPDSHPGFYKMLKTIEKNHLKISKILVPNSDIENVILNTNISSSKVHRIPISINIDNFKFVDKVQRRKSRKFLNINDNVRLIGLFQKDGQGWGQGMDPKLIKGPDVFINCMNLLKSKIPNLQVLLTGPSRGYVKKKLNELKIPYQHHYIKSYQDIQKFYHALDLYIIPSREEGGPRALLESMACGIPLVTTNVGMSIDLVEHQVNGWKVDVEDYEDLCY